MKLARRMFFLSLLERMVASIADPCEEIATITYRSGPEWEQRFGRRMLSEQERDPDGHPGIPKLKPDFLIETYLDHQVRHSSPPLSDLHLHMSDPDPSVDLLKSQFDLGLG